MYDNVQNKFNARIEIWQEVMWRSLRFHPNPDDLSDEQLQKIADEVDWRARDNARASESSTGDLIGDPDHPEYNRAYADNIEYFLDVISGNEYSSYIDAPLSDADFKKLKTLLQPTLDEINAIESGYATPASEYVAGVHTTGKPVLISDSMFVKKSSDGPWIIFDKFDSNRWFAKNESYRTKAEAVKNARLWASVCK